MTRRSGCSTLLQDPAVTGVAIVTTPEEMPVTETLVLLARMEPETGVKPSLLVANRVLPERFDREQAAVFAELDQAQDVIVQAAGRGVTAVLSAARIIEARRQNGEGHLQRLRDEARRVADGRRARTVHAGHWPPSGRARRRCPCWRAASTGRRLMTRVPRPAPCRPDRAARRQGDGARMRVGRSRQDHRPRPRWRCRRRREIGGRVLVLTVDPARRLADALGVGAIGNEARLVPAEAFAASGVEPRGELWAAMLDTKAGWDELIRRHAPERHGAGVGARQPAVSEHHRPLRAQSRLSGDGPTARAARVWPLRSDHRRHASVAERARRARRARAG